MPKTENPKGYVASPTDRTFHNCPPSFWRECLHCHATIRAQDVCQGWHFVLVGRRLVKCGPVSQVVRATGGTPSHVPRYDGKGYHRG